MRKKIYLFRYVLLTVFIFVVSEIKAENGIIPSLYNEVLDNNICGPVRSAELSKLDKSCQFTKTNPLLQLTATNADIFEWSVFQGSADYQVLKNKCLMLRMNSLLNNKKSTNHFVKLIAVGWLARKKAEKIQNICHAITYAVTTVSDELFKKWGPVCKDKEIIKSLEATQFLTLNSLPLAGDEEFFKIFDNNRNILRFKKTGKPITDDQILNSDLSHLNFMEIDPDILNLVTDHINKKLVSSISEKSKVIKEIESTRDSKSGLYNLRQVQKDFLFADNTVYEYLDANPKLSEYPLMGVKCLLNKYKLSLGGELSESLVSTLFWGGLLVKLKNTTELNKLGALKKIILYGSTVDGLSSGLGDSIKSCSSDLPQTQKHKNRSSNQEDISESLKNMPEDLNLKIYDFDEISKTDTEECKKIPNNFVSSEIGSPNCIMTSVINFAPMTIGVPAMLLESHVRE